MSGWIDSIKKALLPVDWNMDTQKVVNGDCTHPKVIPESGPGTSGTGTGTPPPMNATGQNMGLIAFGLLGAALAVYTFKKRGKNE